MKRFTITLIPLLLAGCATLSEPECRTADWQMIGLEDGASGRNISYLAEHRSACAEYSITPNRQAYIEGHNQGVRRFCRAANGFEQGKIGYQYEGICPADLEAEFLYEYQQGYKVFRIQQEIDQLERDLSDKRQQRDKLRERTDNKAAKLLLPNLKELERHQLISDIRAMEREMHDLEHQMEDLDWDIKKLERKRSRLE